MSGFNANEFRSQLKFAGARPNLFEIALTIPDSVEAERQVKFMCEAASSPAYTVGFTSTHFFGREIKHFGDRSWSAWSVQVINDEDMPVRRALESWQDRGSRADWGQKNVEDAKGLQLYTDATIIAYGKGGDALRSIKMFNVFPVLVSPLEYSWSANNQIQKFSVDFEYDYCLEV
jgi:hypothetical protein